jgi:glycosyltransferase involved in cell wall biosynthesis
MTQPRIAVLLPCYNEALTIAEVVKGFSTALPQAKIYVFDNNSTDATADEASKAGAEVRFVAMRGKGNVVRRMFADIDADIYIMADGDNTYDSSQAPELIRILKEHHLDIVIASRQGKEAFPAGHRFGNWLFNKIVGSLFGRGLQDIFSGYRVMTKRFVKSFPAHSQGFETETEMSIHILEMRIPYKEVASSYGERPEGSESKLNTYRDGLRILGTIISVFRDAKPLVFFLIISLLLLIFTMALGIPVIAEWMQTGLVQRIPSAILATGCGMLSALSLVCGIIMDSVIKTHREAVHMRYLHWHSLNHDDAG